MKGFSFAVMGDTHFVRQESHARAFSGKPSGITEYSDLQRNLWMTQHITPKIIDDIAKHKPQFIIHTGDIIPGHCDDEEGLLSEMNIGIDMLRRTDAPLLFSTGSHDGSYGRAGDIALRSIVYPEISKSLNRHVERGYYAFERENCLFLSLDYMTWDKEQYRVVDEILSHSAVYSFVFVYSHPPVVPIARPFFTNASFAADVSALFAKYHVDAYFCGHTHNQTASFHKFGGNTTAQLMSSPLGYIDRPPIMLSDVRPLLPDPLFYQLGWGFLEDSLPGWWLVTVDEDRVAAKWHVLNRGVMGEVQIAKSGLPIFTKIPCFTSSVGVIPEIRAIEEVRLRIAGSGKPSVEIERLTLNGCVIPLPPELAYFDSRQFVVIPESERRYIKPINKLQFAVTGNDKSVGGCVLEIETHIGCVRSSVSGYYTNNASYLNANNAFTPLPSEGEAEFTLSFSEE